MKASIIKKDGTVVQLEGTPEEVAKAIVDGKLLVESVAPGADYSWVKDWWVGDVQAKSDAPVFGAPYVAGGVSTETKSRAPIDETKRSEWEVGKYESTTISGRPVQTGLGGTYVYKTEVVHDGK